MSTPPILNGSPLPGAAASVNSPKLTGLSSQQASELLDQYGPNDPAPMKRGMAIADLFTLFLNPLVIILIVASIASAFLGDVVDAAIILVILLLGVSINFFQTYRSKRTIEKLRENVTPTATVLRDGNWQDIKTRLVVPGDVVRVSAGDLVPADGKLLEARDLFVQQAALTGESYPAEKAAVSVADEPLDESAESPHLLFLGTSVVSGTGTAVISKTGTNTAFGAIAGRLVVRPEETEFERSMRRFGMLIMRAVFVLVFFILVVRIGLHKNAFESLLFTVSLAVGLTPEFLPMITSVTLARGAIRMAKDGVVVKHLPAIQNFGMIDVFCSDKTGTLTTGQMSLEASVDFLGNPSDRPLELAYLNSKFETGIRSPLEVAILKVARSNVDTCVKCDEIPFDFNRRRLSVVVKGEPSSDGDYLLITKGAPEGILELSAFYEQVGQVIALEPEQRRSCRQVFDQLSAQGFRVLAVASRRVDKPDGFTAADESSLVLAGYLAFADPPDLGAAASLAAMKRDGVEVKILTGDNELVAGHIFKQVGLENPTIVLGSEVDAADEPALQHLAEETNIFARVSPVQKQRIINALKHRGHVVGYMGDGINDAPSLHAADVGISVASAVDVAREAADIILLKPGLDTLHDGIIEGRRASANVMKYLLMGTSSNFGNMFSMAGASLFLPFLPMLPTQILLNNFLYDAAQVTIPTDNVDEEYLRKPRKWDMRLIRNFMILIGPISSIYDFLTFFVLLHFLHASQAEFHTGWFVESLATQTLVLFVIRTMGSVFKSHPSLPLTLTTLLVVGIGVALPFSPLKDLLGFTHLPPLYFSFLAIFTVTYLVFVEIAKRLMFAYHEA